MIHCSTARNSNQPGWELLLSNEQTAHAVDEHRLLDAVRRILSDSPYQLARISVAVVDDATIHELNRTYLDHDYPTDVLSFVLDSREDFISGEIVLSADTAAVAAQEANWSDAEEQLLYVVHGMLHLMGHDDHTDDARKKMRSAEQHYLRELGVTAFGGSHWELLHDQTGGVGGTTAW